MTNGHVLYKKTLKKYKEYFGHKPKKSSIWPKKVDFKLKQEDGESWDDYTNRWHTEYALQYGGYNCQYSCGPHDWAKGEFDIECETCVGCSMDIGEVEGEEHLESPFGRAFTCG